jgi:hypothetical protein
VSSDHQQSDDHDEHTDSTPDPRVSTIPLDTEDGETVVIQQQNFGDENQVGGGEFKGSDRTAVDKDPKEADEEQQRLEREAPIDDSGRDG